MNFKSLVLGLCVGLSTTVFATNQHIHPQADNADSKTIEKRVSYPGYCEIEIINNSYENVHISGVFDDGIPLEPFNIYSFESPHYISLRYYGYCHSGMDLYVNTWIYAGYMPRNSTLYVIPYLAGKPKADIKAK
jgi:hypothetical protein